MLTFRPAADDNWAAIETLLSQSALPIAGAREHLGAFLLAFEIRTLHLLTTTAEDYFGQRGL